MKNIIISLALSVGSVVALSGCCEDICRAADDLTANIAAGYAVCCQTEPSEEGWSDCVQAANDRNQEMRDTLIAAEAACQAGQDALVQELLKDFYDILRPRLVEAVSPTGLEGSGSIANRFAIMNPSDQISVSMSAQMTGTKLVKTQPMLVNEEIFSAESAGLAIEAFTIESAQGLTPAASILPVLSVVTEQYQFDSSGSLTVLAGPLEGTLGVVRGRLSVSQLVFDDYSKLVPADLVLELQGDGVDATLSLEDTCPYNELIIDADGNGYLGVAVTLSSESEVFSRIEQLGAFWMTLPVSQGAQGELVFETAGWSVGTDVFPIQPSTMSIALGLGGDIGTLPNGREESCADTNNNSIRDGADEIIGIYDNLGGCD